MSKLTKKEARLRRRRRVRRKISGTPSTPRMAVCRTDSHLYVQFIDDVAQRTLASVSTLEPANRKDGKPLTTETASALGKLAAERAQAVGITRVVFDRGGSRYHGRVKALADAAREAGLAF